MLSMHLRYGFSVDLCGKRHGVLSAVDESVEAGAVLVVRRVRCGGGGRGGRQ